MTIKEELGKEALEIVKLAKDGAMKAVELMYEQTPELVEEIIKFNIFENLIWVIFCLFLIFIFQKVVNWTLKEAKKDDNAYVGTFLTSIPYGITLVCLFCNLVDLIKPLIAPRLYILEYVTALLGKGGG